MRTVRSQYGNYDARAERIAGGILIIIISAIACLSLFNLIGGVGRMIASFLTGVFGYVAYAYAVCGLVVGAMVTAGRRVSLPLSKAIKYVTMFGLAVMVFHAYFSRLDFLAYTGKGAYGAYLKAVYRGETPAGWLGALFAWPAMKIFTPAYSMVFFILLFAAVSVSSFYPALARLPYRTKKTKIRRVGKAPAPEALPPEPGETDSDGTVGNALFVGSLKEGAPAPEFRTGKHRQGKGYSLLFAPDEGSGVTPGSVKDAVFPSPADRKRKAKEKLYGVSGKEGETPAVPAPEPEPAPAPEPPKEKEIKPSLKKTSEPFVFNPRLYGDGKDRTASLREKFDLPGTEEEQIKDIRNRYDFILGTPPTARDIRGAAVRPSSKAVPKPETPEEPAKPSGPFSVKKIVDGAVSPEPSAPAKPDESARDSAFLSRILGEGRRETPPDEEEISPSLVREPSEVMKSINHRAAPEEEPPKEEKGSILDILGLTLNKRKREERPKEPAKPVEPIKPVEPAKPAGSAEKTRLAELIGLEPERPPEPAPAPDDPFPGVSLNLSASGSGADEPGDKKDDSSPEGGDKDSSRGAREDSLTDAGPDLPDDSVPDDPPERPRERSARPRVRRPAPRPGPEERTETPAGNRPKKAEQMSMGDAMDAESRKKPYNPPPADLLHEDPATVEEEDFTDKIQDLESVLASFNINAKVRGVTRGPTFSRFELEMPPGVSVSAVSRFADDIAMKLRVRGGVRFELPIPGQDAFGVEVANDVKTPVGLRGIIESDEFRSGSTLTFGLGRDIGNDVVLCDLEAMPHILIGGATGSGKSACINSLIVSLLYRCGPNDLKLILIDPKRVEMPLYNGLPHLLVPEAIEDVRTALNALDWAAGEMDRRFNLFKGRFRNIGEYNEWARAENRAVLPRIVIVFDELADFMQRMKRQVEDKINRLARLSRAAGIHLVVSTQRPSTDVITGTIKSNLPSRIVLALRTAPDSMTILGAGGAEKLLGNGDMLYFPTSRHEPLRLQGAYVTSEEARNVVEYIKAHNDSDYDPEVRNAIFAPPPEEEEEKEDPARAYAKEAVGKSGETQEFIDILRMCVREKKASISRIQRKFSVGYNHAGRIMDQLEAKGYVSPDKGGNTQRDVFLTEAQFEELYGPMEEEPPEEGE